MRTTTHTLGIGILIAVAVPVVGRLMGDEAGWWALGLMGLILALVLWVMLWCGAVGRTSVARAVVAPRAYAVAGVLGILLGPVLMGLVTDNRVFWPVGFIIAGVIVEATRQARRAPAERRAE